MEAVGGGQGVPVFACPQSEDGEQYSEHAGSIGEPPGYGVTFEVEGLGYIAHAKHYPYLAPVSILAAASYESFSNVFRDRDVQAIYISSDSADDFDPEESQMDDGSGSSSETWARWRWSTLGSVGSPTSRSDWWS